MMRLCLKYLLCFLLLLGSCVLCDASFAAKVKPKHYKSYAHWLAKCPNADKVTKTAKRKALNRSKNRETDPMPGDYVMDFTWENILKKSEDSTRFDTSKAAEITGYVVKIVPGGMEECNCHAATTSANKNYRDTHIELAQNTSKTGKSKRLVIEVGPRVRHNKGWKTLGSNDKSLYHKWVKVKGWLTYDFLHRGNAANTARSKKAIHRATVWEIHPITDIEVIPAP